MARYNTMFVPTPASLALGIKPVMTVILVDDHDALNQLIQRATARAADELGIHPFVYELVDREDASKGVSMLRDICSDAPLGTVTWAESVDPTTYDVVTDPDEDGFLVKGADGLDLIDCTFIEESDAYSAAEGRGWTPADDAVLARRRNALGH